MSSCHNKMQTHFVNKICPTRKVASFYGQEKLNGWLIAEEVEWEPSLTKGSVTGKWEAYGARALPASPPPYLSVTYDRPKPIGGLMSASWF